jgi:hypothetical protein
MKTITRICIMLILFFFIACHKDNGSKEKKNCYVTQTSEANIGQPPYLVTDYIYNSNHTLKRIESYIPGHHTTRNVTEYTYDETLHTFRVDVTGYKGDTLYTHPVYTVYYLNANNRVSHSRFYSCTNCSVHPPTAYSLAHVEEFEYDAQQRKIKGTRYNAMGGLLDYNTEIYDAKGRLIKETTFNNMGLVFNYTTYKYAVDDANNYTRGVLDISQTAIFGDALNIQPLSVTEYDHSGSVVSNTIYDYTPDTGGKVVAAGISYSSGQPVHETYVYECN